MATRHKGEITRAHVRRRWPWQGVTTVPYCRGDVLKQHRDQTTALNSEALRLGDRIGALAPGMEAGLIGVEGDPLTTNHGVAAGGRDRVAERGKAMTGRAAGSRVVCVHQLPLIA